MRENPKSKNKTLNEFQEKWPPKNVKRNEEREKYYADFVLSFE